MMRMGMRVQPNQVGPLAMKFTTGSGVFSRGKYVAAGLRSYKVMLVGASGGRSGRAGSPGYGYVYPAGGGGAASKLVEGFLDTLLTDEAYAVGVKGPNGADANASSEIRSAGWGKAGGTTTFGPHTAVGGRGGRGGFVRTDGALGASLGGEGGLAPGVAAPLWDNALKMGSGGHGGDGASSNGDFTVGAGQSGAQTGAGNAYRATGDVAGAQIGGTGGGANIAPLTGGAAEFHGTGAFSQGDGVIYLVIS